ncbi:alpha/beta hydrolase [Aestuariibacter sp. AA17]|uniref:Alpha/beta hydrolase n=1 Tax=Fluctibacter corallii TaxID=2984329 RepID=A0ABT3A974_9ALTE|nr:alpha/beta hydrolase [Aestuariibacter sp. AA17]MCV2885216.1 alpha/beta hydrolase [Aestuariibacter sp. AA17]
MTRLHFAHANGFPAGSYRQLFEYLPDTWHIEAIDKIGHNPQFPVSRGWPFLIKELEHYLESHFDAPVYGVGHSFGGLLTYLTACHRPDLFKGVIMLDPPVVTGLMRHVAKAVRLTPFFDKITPAGKAAVRCTRWPKDTDLVQYFKQRGLFRHISEDIVGDYVASAIASNEDEHILAFDHQTEAEIFRTVPLNLPAYYNKFTVPGKLVTAEHSDVVKPSMVKQFIHKNGLLHTEFKGAGHMFPLEQPGETAKLIQRTIDNWEHG